MSHFAESEWVDLARGLVQPGIATRMMQHLDTCSACADLYRIWARVALLGPKDLAYQLPADEIRMAKAIFTQHATPRIPNASVAPSWLVWDALPNPLPVGFRTVTSSRRQLLFETDDYQVDLLIKDVSGPKSSLMGQLVARRDPRHGASGVALDLSAGDERVAQTVTNEFGEFQFELDAGRDHTLSIAVRPEPIRLTLKSVSGSVGTDPVNRARVALARKKNATAPEESTHVPTHI